ncbi:hypothetical protein K432DRAFT_425302 [Lepidopterella palustris CBS 459.81]|uniref:Uncharacterized protein n=1 Tax=Lepidopterella palustris CBS 459.81 TaxID=1314670 RepID=A0A8E2ECF7_9PEZI|nr:hypothetical protein K432DRAFT_425302 [Lepidopterella palustris CBS 459.81]
MTTISSIHELLQCARLEEFSLYDGLFEENPRDTHLFNYKGNFHQFRLKILNDAIEQLRPVDPSNSVLTWQPRHVEVGCIAIPETLITEGCLDLSLLWSLYGATSPRVINWLKFRYCDMPLKQLQDLVDAYERQAVRYMRAADAELLIAAMTRCIILQDAINRVSTYGTSKHLNLNLGRKTPCIKPSWSPPKSPSGLYEEPDEEEVTDPENLSEPHDINVTNNTAARGIIPPNAPEWRSNRVPPWGERVAYKSPPPYMPELPTYDPPSPRPPYPMSPSYSPKSPGYSQVSPRYNPTSSSHAPTLSCFAPCCAPKPQPSNFDPDWMVKSPSWASKSPGQTLKLPSAFNAPKESYSPQQSLASPFDCYAQLWRKYAPPERHAQSPVPVDEDYSPQSPKFSTDVDMRYLQSKKEEGAVGNNLMLCGKNRTSDVSDVGEVREKLSLFEEKEFFEEEGPVQAEGLAS